MKKLISLAMAATIAIASLAGCTSSEPDEANNAGTGTEVVADGLYKVGMATDSGTIDDKSFNQGTWEGIKRYETENGTIESKYIQPLGEAKEDYLTTIDTLAESGYQMIVTPGYKFEGAVTEAQKTYPDVKFVLIDGVPNVDGVPEIADNTLSLFFNEQEAGFYAGIAAALESKTGKVGFIGGMEIPAVQKFGWGYVAGVAYANDHFGTSCEVAQYLYSGSFADVPLGSTMAATYYDQGIDVIFAAAGGVGVGVISEAKTRREAGEDVWVIGVDSDQYDDGIYNDKNESVILTSALKNMQQATYDAIDSAIKGDFKGGQSFVLTTKDDAVKLPDENPNLSEDTVTKYLEAYNLVKTDELVVPSTQEELEAFLVEHNYETPVTVEKY